MTKIIIWMAIIGALFAFCWWQGYLKRFSAYIAETREELRKCTWPTWVELKGSTVLVFIMILLLGVSIFVVDLGASKLVLWVNKL